MESPPGIRKKIWIAVSLTMLLIALSGLAVSFLYGDTLRQKVVEALNDKLKARTDVREIDFTVFSSFPYAIVRFNDVRIAEPEEVKSNGTLLKAGTIGFRFHIWDLITGEIHLNGVEVSDAYFASRPRESQLGAWASQQSSELAQSEDLITAFEKYDRQFPNDVPRPPHWGGYAIQGTSIEFWQGRPSRLHDRVVFQFHENSWKQIRKNP